MSAGDGGGRAPVAAESTPLRSGHPEAERWTRRLGRPVWTLGPGKVRIERRRIGVAGEGQDSASLVV